MFLDSLINNMKLNEDDMDNEEYFDEADDYEEEAPKKKVFARPDPKDEVEEERTFKPVRSSSKIAPMKQPAKKGVNGMQVCVIKPTTVDDAREITETLLSNRTVVLNLEGLDVEIAQRIIDFASGSCYAIAGNLQKISQYIFIITPASVDISGDFQDMLAGSFGVPSMNTDL